MALRFGTDGVRGVANAELTPELALALGRAAARVLGGDRVVIGRDTRRSGPMLEAALAAGFAVGRRRRRAGRRGADAGRRLPLRRPALRGRRDLGLPQPLRRQRDQALRARRAQAARRRRGGHRGRARAGAGRRRREPAAAGPGVGTHPDAAGRRPRATSTTSSACSRRPACSTGLRHRRSTAPTGRRARSAPEVFDRLGADVVVHPRRARRLQHQRPLRRHPSRARWLTPSVVGGCRRSAWPSTATATG